MTQEQIVCDASVLVAVLTDDGEDGAWSVQHTRGRSLAAPDVVVFEVANVLRRAELAGLVGRDVANQAHDDLLALRIERWPYEVIAARAWELRHHVATNDATYVAVAELLGVPLVTLDRRLSRAHGLRCTVETP